GELAIFDGQGDGTFYAPVLVPLNGSPTSVTTADLDGDSITDVIVGEQTSFEVFARGLKGNAFANNTTVPTPFPIIGAATGHLTGGAHDDFALLGGPDASGVGQVMAFNGSSGIASWTFIPYKSFPVANPRSIAIGKSNLRSSPAGFVNAD